MKIPALILLALLPLYNFAQDPKSDDPLDWKNRKPHPGYWQQDVNYSIEASLDYQTGIVTGNEILEYTNNSPDTLKEVYFHLYQNAFQPGSYLHHLSLANDEKPRYGNYEAKGLGTVTESVTGSNVKGTILDNTILKVLLHRPILPGAKEKFEIRFKTYFDAGSVRRRMKKFTVAGGHVHYDLVHWYPRICVYDRKFGWEIAQHLGKEFYGDYGQFDVKLTVANHYIVDGTGVLMNREEVMPAELRARLDLKNFKDKPIGSAPSEILKPDGTTKTWHFNAKNVHDFALTMDPTYRIGEAKANNGISCIALVQESNAAGWQDAAEFTAKVIDIYSRDFGQYHYPKMIVADARDGMEYPMLTLDGGLSPGNHFVIAHEVGHNWFYGMVGNNETYRAALDEGFTQYLTAWSLTRIDGEYPLTWPETRPWMKKFSKPTKTNERTIYQAYLQDAMNHDDPPLNTHSDDFNSALAHGGGYRHVYYKTATMLANLQYVLGDELFTRAMKNYFNQWKFAHPYFEDFRNSIIQYTHVDLNWFFDQWLETNKTIDYSIVSVKKKKETSVYGEGTKGSFKLSTYQIVLKRKGEMQMPVDLQVTTTDGKTLFYTIPNSEFIKQESNIRPLPKWTGWGKLHEYYCVDIVVEGKIKEVTIDPSGRLADINQLNNTTGKKASWQFDHQISNAPDRFHHENYWRPDLWYNSVDGLKAGIHLNGNYYQRKHRYDVTLWYNTGLGRDDKATTQPDIPLSISADYMTAIGKDLYFSLGSRFLDGMAINYAGITKTYRNDRCWAQIKSMVRPDFLRGDYLLYNNLMPYDQFNNTVNLGYHHDYRYPKGNGQIEMKLRTPFLFSDFDFSSISGSAINHNSLGLFDIRTRGFAQLITGNTIARASALYLAGANPEELLESKYTRARGIVPDEWLGYNSTTNHFHAGGGLNLRGYAGYFGWYEGKDGIYAQYWGNAGASASAEIDFDKLFPVRIRKLSFLHIDTYLFGDVGMIYNKNIPGTSISPFRADAGLGTALTIQRWGVLNKVRPLTIRFDMPFFLNTPPHFEDYFKFRWVMGIGRSF